MISLLPQEHINQLYSKEKQTMDEPTKRRDKHANENKVCHVLTNHILNFTSCSRHMWLVMFLVTFDCLHRLLLCLFCISSWVIFIFYSWVTLGCFWKSRICLRWSKCCLCSTSCFTLSGINILIELFWVFWVHVLKYFLFCVFPAIWTYWRWHFCIFQKPHLHGEHKITLIILN